MPITLTNNTAGILDLSDTPLLNIGASGVLVLPNTQEERTLLCQSELLKSHVLSGDITGVTTLAAGDELVNTLNVPVVGTMDIHSEPRLQFLAKTSGPNHILPPSPVEGEAVYSPLTKLTYHYDADAGSWLSDSVYTAVFTKTGLLVASDWIPLYGTTSNVGAVTTVQAVIINFVVNTSSAGSSDECVFGVYKNAAQVDTFTKPGSSFNTFEAGLALDFDVTGALETGYRLRFESTAGTAPTDVVISMSFRLLLQ